MGKSVHSLERWDRLDLIVKSGVDDISVCDLGVLGSGRLVGQGVLHPVDIVSFFEVVSGVGTSGFLSVFSSVDSHLSLNQQIFEFEGLDKVGVPDIASVTKLDIVVHL